MIVYLLFLGGMYFLWMMTLRVTRKRAAIEKVTTFTEQVKVMTAPGCKHPQEQQLLVDSIVTGQIIAFFCFTCEITRLATPELLSERDNWRETQLELQCRQERRANNPSVWEYFDGEQYVEIHANGETNFYRTSPPEPFMSMPQTDRVWVGLEEW